LRHHGAPHSAPRFFSGFTLVELVLVLVVLAIVSYFVIRSFAPRDSLSLQQAERLRNDLQHAQMLALTWGQALRVTTAANAYSVSCVSAGAAPCNASPVVNPANGQPFSVTLETGLTLAGPGFSLDFDALGRPKNGGAFITAQATYTISGASVARTVTVTPLTGLARAQ
jgi:prepilin-type N-terminal cleavage/methylation domain-containing protein